jgi:hypothetical protein
MSAENATKRDVRALDLQALKAFFAEHNQQAFRAYQVYEWEETSNSEELKCSPINKDKKVTSTDLTR